MNSLNQKPSAVLILSLFLSCSIVCGLNNVDNVSISAFPQSCTAEIGSQVTFNCSINNSELANNHNIRWYHGLQPLPQSSVRITGLLQLVMVDVQVVDAGRYSCCVVQDVDEGCGASSVDVELEVGLPPKPVEGLTCYSRDTVNGYCVWNTSKTDSFLGTSYKLERRKSGPWLQAPCKEIPSEVHIAADHVCYIEVKGGASYQYRVVSRNTLGLVTTQMTDPPVFSIFNDAVPLPPQTISVAAQTSHSLLVSWEPPPGFSGGLQCRMWVGYRMRYIYYNSSQSTWIYSEHNAWSNMADICHPTFLIDKLYPPYSKVCIQLSSEPAKNNVGKTAKDEIWSEWSEVKCTRLLEKAPDEAPGEFLARSTNHEANHRLFNVDLTWKPLPESKQNGKILGYNISVIGYLDTKTTFWKIHLAYDNETLLHLQDLNKTYEYTFEIVAFNSAGSSPSASVTVQPTPVRVPGENKYVVTAVAVVLPIAVAVICLITCCCWKKLSDLPQYDVKMPSIVSTSSNYTNSILTTFHVPEREQFDELSEQRADIGGIRIKTPNYQNERVTMNIYQNFPYNGQTSNPAEFDSLPHSCEHVEETNIDNLVNTLHDGLRGQSSNIELEADENSHIEEGGEICYHIMTPKGLSPVKQSKVMERSAIDDAEQFVGECTTLLCNIPLVQRDDVLGENCRSNQNSSISKNDSTDEISPYVKQTELSQQHHKRNIREGPAEVINPYVQQSEIPLFLSKTEMCNKSPGKMVNCNMVKQGDENAHGFENCVKETQFIASDEETFESPLITPQNGIILEKMDHPTKREIISENLDYPSTIAYLDRHMAVTRPQSISTDSDEGISHDSNAETLPSNEDVLISDGEHVLISSGEDVLTSSEKDSQNIDISHLFQNSRGSKHEEELDIDGNIFENTISDIKHERHHLGNDPGCHSNLMPIVDSNCHGDDNVHNFPKHKIFNSSTFPLGKSSDDGYISNGNSPPSSSSTSVFDL